jgi:uncharacterized damage-inducible protein DinB
MAELSEEQLRIRGYLQSQAAKLSVPELLDKVRADSDALRAACESAADLDYTARPEAESWSVNEVLAHLADTCTTVNQAILAAWRDGQPAAPLEDALQHTTAAKTPIEWWQAIHDEREAAFAALAQARGDEHLDLTWDHPFFGNLNWREWVLFLRLHDGDHARQVQSIVAAQAAA